MNRRSASTFQLKQSDCSSCSQQITCRSERKLQLFGVINAVKEKNSLSCNPQF